MDIGPQGKAFIAEPAEEPFAHATEEEGAAQTVITAADFVAVPQPA